MGAPARFKQDTCICLAHLNIQYIRSLAILNLGDSKAIKLDNLVIFFWVTNI